MGSGHTVVADNVVHDITVYGSNESVFYKSGDPVRAAFAVANSA